ncbi:MAG: hypothetical protein H7211_11075 [Aquabacterium sp.]|nr:hypothetical protein [Ferruginibacter sp.]
MEINIVSDSLQLQMGIVLEIDERCSNQDALPALIKSAGKFPVYPLKNQGCLSPAASLKYFTTAGEFLDFRIRWKFSAFLFAPLIFLSGKKRK